jgi:hypothetical protein
MNQDTAEAPASPVRAGPVGNGLEDEITEIGRALGEGLRSVLGEVPGSPRGPQALATSLGLDKVLTSRVLKAARNRDPMAVAHHVPGPEPLRRLIKAAHKAGVSDSAIERAGRAVDRFDQLIRTRIGDRSALDAIISAWLPEARRDFELRRKQSAFKAMSQLKGVMTNVNLGTVFLHPSDDGEHLDIIWIVGLLGLQRLRPAVSVKVTTRRMAQEDAPRQPTTLSGKPIETVEDARLDAFCDAPPAPVSVQRVGDVIHYFLGGSEFGPHSAVDLVLAEVNLREMPRYVPRELGRKGNVFAEVATPSRSLLFDVLVHEDVYPGSEPALFIYDTVLEGVADVNDRRRDVDRLDLIETTQMLGRGAAPMRIAQVPRYIEMLRHVFGTMGWSEAQFRGYRCNIDYPVYGSQVVLAFDPPPPPDGD